MAANKVRPHREQYRNKNQALPQLPQKALNEHIIDAQLADTLASKVFIHHGSITNLQHVEAVVNPTMKSLWTAGTGVSGVIFRQAGVDNLQKACEAIISKADNNQIPVGHTVITAGFDLNAKYILHTVAPYYTTKDDGSKNDYLKSCYITSLNLCIKNNIKTVAFPCIGTGDGNYSKPTACLLALNAVKAWLCDMNQMKYIEFMKNDKNENPIDIADIFADENVVDRIDSIIFCCFDDQNWNLYRDDISKCYPASNKQHSYLWVDKQKQKNDDNDDNDEKKQEVENNANAMNQKLKLFAKTIQHNIDGKLTEYDAKFEEMNNTIETLLELNKQKDEEIKLLNDKVIQLLEEKKENEDNDYMDEMKKLRQGMNEINAKIKALDIDNKTLSKQEQLKGFLEDANSSKYYDLFIENGFESIESLYNLTGDDLKEIGITKFFDRKQLLDSILVNKNKIKQPVEGNTYYH